MEVRLKVVMEVELVGSTENHAWQRLRALQGKKAAAYRGALVAGDPIFSVISIEKLDDTD